MFSGEHKKHILKNRKEHVLNSLWHKKSLGFGVSPEFKSHLTTYGPMALEQPNNCSEPRCRL